MHHTSKATTVVLLMSDPQHEKNIAKETYFSAVQRRVGHEEFLRTPTAKSFVRL